MSRRTPTWATSTTRAARALAALALAAALAAPACSHKADDGTEPRPDTAGSLPALTVRDDSPNLMLTWIDERGETHVELHPADVPAEGKPLVRVLVSDRDEGTRELFWVVDLTKGEGGAYAARTMSRREWEKTIEERRAAHLAKIAPPPPAVPPPAAPEPTAAAPAPGDRPPPAQDTSGVTVIIYGAPWCGACHEAAAYLRSRGVKFVEKDVDSDAAAQAEMRDKLLQIGRRPGSIPVIDVRGKILVGYSRSELDRALSKASGGTML